MSGILNQADGMRLCRSRAVRAFQSGFGLRTVAFVVVLLGTISLSNRSFSQNTNRPASSNRWLVIMDMSRSMERRAESAQNIAVVLVMSGMNGQMRAGDTLGLWTFNQSLSAGKFPLQEWSPATSKTVARRVYEFLKSEKYEKDGRLEKVVPEMLQIIKDSELITVILISDGQKEIHGTPFDDKINATYRQWQKQQQKILTPFITLLRAKGGQLTDYAVNMPPWPLEMPPLPPEPLIAKVPEKKPPPEQVPQSLIFSGSNPKPAHVEIETTSEPIASNPPQPVPETPAPKPETPVDSKPVLATDPAPQNASAEKTNC